jgi:HEAT repeat protein
LKQIGRKDRHAIQVLGNALNDADAGVRREAAKALGVIGGQTEDVVPPLRRALVDPDEAVRDEAAAALKKIGG